MPGLQEILPSLSISSVPLAHGQQQDMFNSTQSQLNFIVPGGFLASVLQHLLIITLLCTHCVAN